MSEPIRFLLNGERVDVTGLPAQTTLLEYLRDERRLTGTKEGCAEGDCGACTVMLCESDAHGSLKWNPINACIRLLPSVDGKAVFTVEALRSDDATLHPVQQALVECHGSQCGFCTPGFVMSLFGVYKNAFRPQRGVIEDALSGNLCRCTGYRPIVTAAVRMYDLPAPEGWRAPGMAADGSRRVSVEEEGFAAQLDSLERDSMLEYGDGTQRWLAPRTIDELAAACAAQPHARLVAGATDVGLWITKQLRDLSELIYVGEVAALKAIRETSTYLEIGAAASLTDAFAALERDWPELHEAWVRFASIPIRNSGTLGGNVANGSPIGDSMPALIAMAASVVLRKGAATREIPLEALYLGYQKTALEPGEFVAAVRIPRRAPNTIIRAYKVSKRFDQDISGVFACFALQIRGDRIVAARIGCGGVAPTPVRADKTEAVLEGRNWDERAAEAAAEALTGEFSPITDMRASADYRRVVLGNLMRRVWLETHGAAVVTRVEMVAAD